MFTICRAMPMVSEPGGSRFRISVNSLLKTSASKANDVAKSEKDESFRTSLSSSFSSSSARFPAVVQLAASTKVLAYSSNLKVSFSSSSSSSSSDFFINERIALWTISFVAVEVFSSSPPPTDEEERAPEANTFTSPNLCFCPRRLGTGDERNLLLLHLPEEEEDDDDDDDKDSPLLPCCSSARNDGVIALALTSDGASDIVVVVSLLSRSFFPRVGGW